MTFNIRTLLTIHWIYMWPDLQPAEQRQDMDIGCNHLETVARDIYGRRVCTLRHCRIGRGRVASLGYTGGTDTWDSYPPHVRGSETGRNRQN
jgi:hypothetical protein